MVTESMKINDFKLHVVAHGCVMSFMRSSLFLVPVLYEERMKKKTHIKKEMCQKKLCNLWWRFGHMLWPQQETLFCCGHFSALHIRFSRLMCVGWVLRPEGILTAWIALNFTLVLDGRQNGQLLGTVLKEKDFKGHSPREREWGNKCQILYVYIQGYTCWWHTASHVKKCLDDWTEMKGHFMVVKKTGPLLDNILHICNFCLLEHKTRREEVLGSFKICGHTKRWLASAAIVAATSSCNKIP